MFRAAAPHPVYMPLPGSVVTRRGCGCPDGAHRHYRPGSVCALCSCTALIAGRTVPHRATLAWLAVMAVLVAAGAAALLWLAVSAPQ